jgi:hypothetical protein
MLTRRQFLALGLASGLPGCVSLKDLQPNCPINWAPSLTAPVFYGYTDYGECSGASCISAVPKLAPGAVPPWIYDQVRPAMRVYYPTLDGTPSGAAILDLCERFPLVLLVHGDCGGNPYYQWDLMPAQLARCGYVVAVTQYGGVLSQGQTSDTLKLHQAERWLRTYWEHADRIMAPPNTAVIGHSYGATLAAQLATEMPLKAFASLSGVFGQVLWEPARTMLSRIQVPSLFCWNDNDDVGVNADMSHDDLWDAVGLPKHGVVFMKGHHGDYLRLNTAPTCPQSSQPGDCYHVPGLATDFVTAFMAKYMPPQYDFAAFTLVPDNLFVRPQDLPAPPQNGFYAGGFLSSFAQSQKYPGSQPPPSNTCVERVLWKTPSILGFMFVASS